MSTRMLSARPEMLGLCRLLETESASDFYLFFIFVANVTVSSDFTLVMISVDLLASF